MAEEKLLFSIIGGKRTFIDDGGVFETGFTFSFFRYFYGSIDINFVGVDKSYFSLNFGSTF